MPKAKIAITIDEATLARLDRLVADGASGSRSQAVALAVEEHLARREHARLARECAKLDPAAEQATAEEGLAGEAAAWPGY